MPAKSYTHAVHLIKPTKNGVAPSAISVIGRVNVFPVLISRAPTSSRSLIARSVG